MRAEVSNTTSKIGLVPANELFFQPNSDPVFARQFGPRNRRDANGFHAVTAVGASGPAFLLLACEAMADAAVEAGLPRDDALAWARAALVAAAARWGPGLEPQQIRATITSPAGTTAAGLSALESGAARAAFADAVRAAVARSREL